MVDAVRAAPISAMVGGCEKEPRERLREIRQAKGLTQQELANKSGQSRMAVGAHESGQNNIRPEVAVKYAQALGCTPEWLLFGRAR